MLGTRVRLATRSVALSRVLVMHMPGWPASFTTSLRARLLRPRTAPAHEKRHLERERSRACGCRTSLRLAVRDKSTRCSSGGTNQLSPLLALCAKCKPQSMPHSWPSGVGMRMSSPGWKQLKHSPRLVLSWSAHPLSARQSHEFCEFKSQMSQAACCRAAIIQNENRFRGRAHVRKMRSLDGLAGLIASQMYLQDSVSPALPGSRLPPAALLMAYLFAMMGLE